MSKFGAAHSINFSKCGDDLVSKTWLKAAGNGGAIPSLLNNFLSV
jgi:hypothetical protein